jgi:squalene synthase HpnC
MNISRIKLPPSANSHTKAIVQQETLSLQEARAYCRTLAHSHYENFIVASLFLPSSIRQHFYNIYAFCRISDDLGDESESPIKALELLDCWEEELTSCYQGNPRHPVFQSLRETIEEFHIPIEPFSNLLEAFKRDQKKNRYQTYAELLDYCRYSANPVGHLVLYLAGYGDQERQSLSDKTCTALQLANHWQDIERDLVRLDRIYIPLEDMHQFDYTEADLRAKICDQRFIALMRMEIERARLLFHEGLDLCHKVGSRFAMDIELFNRCGLEILRKIELVHYDVFRKRPTLGTWSRLRILARSWGSNLLKRSIS